MIEKTTIAAKVGRTMRRAEGALDLALADAALALAECARSRQVLGLHASEGQHGIIKLSESIAGLVKVQANLRHAHGTARQVGEIHGFAPDQEECPWPGTTGEIAASETAPACEDLVGAR